MYDLIIIGGGPCGVMAAITASKRDLKVLIVDQNSKLLTKLEASGNGRCNITNNKSVKEFLEYVHPKPKFFYSIIKNFSPHDIIEYFLNLDVNLKEEKNGKMYPESNKASTISDALRKELSFVTVKLNTKIDTITKENDIFTVSSAHKVFEGKAVLFSTGGRTYQKLGTDGSSYALIESLDHTITNLTTQECPIITNEIYDILQGISLYNTNISITKNNKILHQDTNDLLFTHFGLTGPAILNCSFTINDHYDKNTPLFINIQLLNLNYEQCHSYLQNLIKDNPKKFLKNCLPKIPNKLLEYILSECKISEIKNADLNKHQIKQLTHFLSSFKFTFKQFYRPEYAFVTGGGVNLNEINNKTLESKLIPNLYFGGEILDVACSLGGYNITTALACGKTIGENVMLSKKTSSD